ncbi:flagellar hook-basal body protein FliE [Aeoliella mucimassa]|uniref:Flagellar hook-basal body complex protein FliE n=2 Tax=Aeoliella mucimassa TaxID=2527972 RepID=A0A518AKR8_9BACT|nr:flagellar hook-basal body protein FliE [Aeoliella mucimassa]
MNSITSTQSTTSMSMPMSLTKSVGQSNDSSFKDMLVDSIKEVNSMQQEADQAVEALFTGQDINPAEVLSAVQKADMAFRLTMQMRNKAMDVYREIREIQI